MSEIKLVVVDLDETLLTSDKTYDVDRFKKILHELESQGTLFVIATGNNIAKVSDYFDSNDLDGVYVAGNNGSELIKNDEVIHRLKIKRETANLILDFLDEFDGYYAAISTIDNSYTTANIPEVLDIMKIYTPNIQYIEETHMIPEDELILKIAIQGAFGLEQNKVLGRIIKERYEGVQAVSSGDGWLDVIHADSGKGGSVKYLQDKYDILPTETIVFGDSMNDASMADWTPYSVAMENADSELKSIYRYQIGNNNDQSVFDILEEYLAAGNLDFLEAYRIDRH